MCELTCKIIIDANKHDKLSINDWFIRRILMTVENIDLFCFSTIKVAKLAVNPVKVITN